MQRLRSSAVTCHSFLAIVFVTLIVLCLCGCCCGFSVQPMSYLPLLRKPSRAACVKLQHSCTMLTAANHRQQFIQPVMNSRFGSQRYFHNAVVRLSVKGSDSAHTEDTVLLDSVDRSSTAYEADLADFGGNGSGDVSFDHLVSSSAYKCQISPYWIDQLKVMERPAAKNLIAKLLPTNPLGYELATGAPKKGTLLESMIQWKRQHEEQLILARVGEFYESCGVDALMMINYAGLNPMGGAARAGCPARNIQATLDSLTQAGLSVAVFEELSEIDAGRGPATTGKAKLKTRVLSQIVSPASSTYIYDKMCLRSDDIEFRENRPAVGILRTVNGYTLCQVHLDTAVMVISERLTEEGVRSLVAASGHIEPVYLQDCSAADLAFLSHVSSGTTSSSGSPSGVSSGGSGGGHQFEKLSGYTESDFPDQVLRRLSRKMEISVENIRKSNRNQLQGTNSGAKITGKSSGAAPAPPLMPIYTSTALQIGLIANDNVPDLVPSLLPARSSAFSARFLRKWLLNPPPADIADHMRSLCTVLMSGSGSGDVSQISASSDDAALDIGVSMQKQDQNTLQDALLVPRFTPVSIAKVVTLINANQCNVALFKEIRHNIHALQLMLCNAHFYRDSLHQPTTKRNAARTSNYDHTSNDLSALVEPLLALTSYESGVQAEYEQLLQETATVLEKIDFVIPSSTVNTETATADVPFTDPFERIPLEFFADNEREFRNKLLPSHPEVSVIYAQVDVAAKALCQAVNTHFAPGFVVQYDINNNAVVLRNERVSAGRNRDKTGTLPTFDADQYTPFIDRKGAVVRKSFTVEAVTSAWRCYLQATATAESQVSQVLQNLSRSLQGRHLISIVQAAHWAVILESVTSHSVSSRQRGWTVPKMVDFAPDSSDTSASSSGSKPGPAATLDLSGLSPYWMDRATCTLNPVQLKGLYLLTAPNMSGKSTLMRSVLVAALLANCGLCVPCSAATVPRYDHYFLRTASYDVPSEAKSAFALEMDDVRVMMRDCTHKSLVMIDELGKGTSAKDGSSLSGALLEHLDSRGISGIFATHLHELFLLPLMLHTVTEKKMGYCLDEAGNVNWNYHLEDGRCVDSMALVTARKYGIDASIVHRAGVLADTFDRLCRSGQNTSSADASTSVPSIVGNTWTKNHSALTKHSAQHTEIADDGAGSEAVATEAKPAAKPLPPGRRYNLNSDVVPLIRTVSAENSAGLTPVIQMVPAAFEVPPSLEGTACVYVLQIYSLTKESLPDLLYVGETESIRQRLKQHRDTYKKNGYSFNAAVLSVRDKSLARRVETTLINNLKAKGFDIENDTDSKHVLFSASSSSGRN